MRRLALVVSMCLPGCDAIDSLLAQEQSEPTPAVRVDHEEQPDEDDAPPWPEGSVLTSPVQVPMAVYALPDSKERLETVAKTVLATHAETFGIITEAEAREGKQGVVINLPAIDTYAPPSLEDMQYLSVGVSPEDAKAVQGCETVVELTFTDSKPENAPALVAQAQTIIGEIAQRSGGLPWDESTRQLFGRDAWDERTKVVPAPTAEALIPHFTIHMYRNGEYIRLVTLGLSKLALPEIAVDNVAQGDGQRMAALINATVAALFDTHAVGPDGSLVVTGNDGKADTKTSIRLGKGTRLEGDSPAPLATIRFPGKGALQARHAALLSAVLGAPEDELIYSDRDDKALIAASEAAKKELAKLESHFADGVPDQESLSVKAPFTTNDGGTEWMWVEVTRWSGTSMRGVLLNRPYHVPDLHEGDTVDVEVGSVFDYIHGLPDGTQAGGTTNDIIAAQQKTRGR